MNNRDFLEKMGVMPASAGAGTYVLGFVLSLALTLFAYFLATTHAFTPSHMVAALLGLALLQFAVQALCFLHLGPHTPRSRSTLFFIAFGIVVVLMGGSVIIMNRLNSRMMPSNAQMEQYMQQEDAF